MTREQAEALMKGLLAPGDIEERAALRRPLGEMMADLSIELQRPIIEQFPDLDPDKGGDIRPL